ncbi:hypothetical protein LSUE1_G006679 [Lachnellula suecica]|uniref:6-phosphogluconolactonase n=1 Tax=Lachnellula suecica TaxID=602035 RepID=A0A8T9BZF5_9HELO|nr:hypothetical protein LSUE1_G006679 [Lachnellula suecica]
MPHLHHSICWVASLVTAAAALLPPDCQTTAPTQEALDVRTANLSVPSFPFGLAYASNSIAFSSLTTGIIGVLNTSNFEPTLIRTITIPAPYYETGYAISGIAITRDKRTLYATVGQGAVAIDVQKAVSGEANSIVGFLNGTVGISAVEVTLSADDKYAFVSQEYGNVATRNLGAIEVFGIDQSINGSISSTYVGYIALGDAVVGMALSADGSKLYATSEQVGTVNTPQGTLSVLDVETLKTNPSDALLASFDAGCSPVRIAVSQNGEHVWVTARESNMLLAFDAAKLNSNPANSTTAIVASVQVGTSPVGVVFVNHGKHIITADSNRFDYTNTPSGLTVVDVEGKQGFPSIPTGEFPREFAVSPDNKTLLVSQYGSQAIQVVDLFSLA